MPEENVSYIVGDIGEGLRSQGYKQFIPAGTVVKCLEYAPEGSWDVVDVQLPSGELEQVYSFQLEPEGGE